MTDGNSPHTTAAARLIRDAAHDAVTDAFEAVTGQLQLEDVDGSNAALAGFAGALADQWIQVFGNATTTLDQIRAGFFTLAKQGWDDSISASSEIE